MNTFEKVEFTSSVHHNERFLKSGITIYNSEILDTAGTQAIAKRYAFYVYANEINSLLKSFLTEN